MEIMLSVPSRLSLGCLHSSKLHVVQGVQSRLGVSIVLFIYENDKTASHIDNEYFLSTIFLDIIKIS